MYVVFVWFTHEHGVSHRDRNQYGREGMNHLRSTRVRPSRRGHNLDRTLGFGDLERPQPSHHRPLVVRLRHVEIAAPEEDGAAPGAGHGVRHEGRWGEPIVKSCNCHLFVCPQTQSSFTFAESSFWEDRWLRINMQLKLFHKRKAWDRHACSTFAGQVRDPFWERRPPQHPGLWGTPDVDERSVQELVGQVRVVQLLPPDVGTGPRRETLGEKHRHNSTESEWGPILQRDCRQSNDGRNWGIHGSRSIAQPP